MNVRKNTASPPSARLDRVPWLRLALLISLLAVTMWFAGQRIANGAGELDRQTLVDHAWPFAAAIAAFAAGTLLLGVAWIVLLEGVTPDAPRRRSQLMIAFVYAWLGRYVPGTVPFFAGKIYLGGRVGYSTRPLIVTTAVQNVLEILVSSVVGAAMIAASQGIAGRSAYSALAVLPAVGLVALHPRFLRRLVDASLRVLRRDPLPDDGLPPARALAVAAAFVACNQIVNGVALFLLLHVIAGIGASGVLLAIGALSLAGVVSILVVLVPAGLGVREGILAALLTTRVAVESAALIAVLLRLLTVVADLVLFAAAFVIDIASSSRVASRALHSGRSQAVPVAEPAIAGRRSA